MCKGLVNLFWDRAYAFLVSSTEPGTSEMESFETEMHESDAQGADVMERFSNDFKDLYRHQACMSHWGIHRVMTRTFLRDLEPPHGNMCRSRILFPMNKTHPCTIDP